MKNLKVLVTGSSGLIGSEAVTFYDGLGASVIGVDNNMRAVFFGAAGDTQWNLKRVKKTTKNFKHLSLDIRNRKDVEMLFQENNFNLIIHCAAQPSHDKAAEIPILDFEVNALGTVNLLEATRQHSPGAVFIFMSTNKVYGDAPNERALIELEKRFDFHDVKDYQGINEMCRIDQCLHSVFGASKTAADIMVQEYGKYFGLKAGVFRGGCLTGPSHSGVAQHGFLNFLVKTAVRGEIYQIHGYKGKQVRDNIHSHDVVRLFEEFRKNPRLGEVYNLGGGRENSISILEAIDKVNSLTQKPLRVNYSEKPRKGDHVCYISDLRKIHNHFPDWKITRNLDQVLQEMVRSEMMLGRNAD